MTPLTKVGKRLDNITRFILDNNPQDKWVLSNVIPMFLEAVKSSTTIQEEQIIVPQLNKLLNNFEFRYNQIFERKKKADRCLRIARRKIPKSSAYRSGNIERCRQGDIWKDLKEADDLTIKNNYIDEDGELDFEQIQNDLIKTKPYYKSLLPNYLNNTSLTDNQINQLIELFIDNEADIFDSSWMVDADKIKFNQRWRKADIDDLSDWFISFVEGLSDNWGELELKETDNPQSGKAAPYGSGYAKLKETILNIIKEDESLRKWFSRKGEPGKKGGWVDCNTCREVDGKTKCKACGREKGETRSKYPSCRPTAAQCKTPGKGKKWGKTK